MISIIIPVYNDPEGLNDTLGSLVKQNYPKQDYEIIVADNGSKDSTVQVAQEYQRDWPDLVKIVIEDKIQSSYAARNRGVEVARGEIISFVDADMTVGADWLGKVVTALKEHDADYLGCNVRIYSTRHSVASLYDIVTGFKIRGFMENAHYAPTCCLTVKRDLFQRIGMFDERLKSGGDGEFGRRAWNAGVKFHYAQNIFMHHPARGTVSALLKKSMRIGEHGRGHTSILFPDQTARFNRLYLTWARYVPRKPWKTRGRYRGGFAYKTSTVILIGLLPVLSHYVSTIGYVRAKLRHHLTGRLKAIRSRQPK